jgi:hypothetical protein
MAILNAYSSVAGFPVPASYANAVLLAANTPEFFTVPTDQEGKKARIVKLDKTSATAVDFYAQCYNTTDGTDRTTNGTFAEYVTNGTFASDTGWTKGTGWTIAAGVATATGAISTALSQTAAITLIPGFSYTVTFTVTAFTAGTISCSLGGGTAGTARGSAATFIETIVAGSTDQLIQFNTAGFTGSIDNVTISGWILGTGWTTDGATAIATGAISTALSQTANAAYPIIEGRIYYVTYTATRSAGTVTVNVGGTAGTARSSSATFSELIIAGSSQAISFTTSGFTGTIDNVTILPATAVPADTTLGTAGDLNPTGYFLGEGGSNSISTIAVISAGTPIISAKFYR